MKQIDKLVTHLLRFGADALLVSSNGPVVARIASGDRASNQVLDHASVVAMIQEIAPPAALAELRASRLTRFVYDGPQPMNLEVTPAPGAWKVVLSPVPETHFPLGQSPAQGAERLSQPEAPRISHSPNAPLIQNAPREGSSPGISSSPGSASRTPRKASRSSLHPASAREVLARLSPAPDQNRIDRLLRAMTARGASDLHLSSGAPPMIRLHGEVQKLEEAGAFTDDALRAMLMPIVPPRNRAEFDERRDTDFAYELVGLARFRVNIFMDRMGIGAVLRRIPYEIMSPEKLGLSLEVLDLCNLSRGLVLVTGPTGSGKSTTLASMIDRINATRDDHIITIEDPIEFVHEDKRCLINQREVHVHTESFRHALRAALRQDPDIVLVGEMRDLETVEIAIETAETGHLVFGTLHTSTAPSTIDRIIDQFSPDRQSQVRTMLSESLKGVIAQTLCRKLGGGRVAAYEVLIGTPAVANIIREGKAYQLHGVMQGNRSLGMITLNDALMDLLQRGLIDPREAYMRAGNKHEMRTLLINGNYQQTEP